MTYWVFFSNKSFFQKMIRWRWHITAKDSDIHLCKYKIFYMNNFWIDKQKVYAEKKLNSSENTESWLNAKYHVWIIPHRYWLAVVTPVKYVCDPNDPKSIRKVKTVPKGKRKELNLSLPTPKCNTLNRSSSVNGCTVEWEWMNNVIPHFMMNAITYPFRDWS